MTGSISGYPGQSFTLVNNSRALRVPDHDSDQLSSRRKCKLHIENPFLARIHMLKTKLAAELQHRLIVPEDLADNGVISLILAVSDRELHQAGAQAMSLQIGSHKDGKFRIPMIRVGMKPYHPQNFAGPLVKGQECYGAAVVELGELGNEVMAELPHRREETQADILWGYFFKK